MGYDVVIRNGTVVDGSGLGSYRADVGLRDGRIATIGRIREKATHVLDAEGHFVTPGFIDGHSHMDAQVFWDPLGTSSCWHGVTTVIMGHCGFTLAPSSEDQSKLVVRNLERAEDISGDAMAAGIKWSWTTFREYLDTVESLPMGINYVANIGHSALRTFVMGERAFTEQATAADIAEMKAELSDALRAGAYGFTTSRTMHHMTSDDRPVASRLASWDEVRDLVLCMGDHGVGIFQFVEDAPPAERQAQRDAEIVALAVESGVPFAIGATGGNPRSIELIERTAREGGRMFGLTHSRGIGTLTSFRSQLPFDTLPEWQEIRRLSFDELRVALRDPAVRDKLVWAAHNRPFKKTYGGEARPPEYDRLQVMARPIPPHKTVAQVASERGVDPVAAMIDLALETDFHQLFAQSNTPFDYDAVKAVMKHPRTVMAFSDSGAHVSQMSDCSIQTHLLAHWVRDRQDFTWEEAIRMLTFAPARAWGFHDRGLLREGMVADINVFDPDTICPDMPYVVYDLPGGAKRLKQTATGILATIVGGHIVHHLGEHTGALPGQLIRGPLAAG